MINKVLLMEFFKDDDIKVVDKDFYIKSQMKSDVIKYITILEDEEKRLNNIIKNLDKMFEYYFLGNLKYDQDTVNTIYIKYVELKELKQEN